MFSCPGLNSCKYASRQMKVHIVRLARIMVLMVKRAEGVNWRMQDTENELRGRSEWTTVWQGKVPALTEWHKGSWQAYSKQENSGSFTSWASSNLEFTSAGFVLWNLQMRGTEPTSADLSTSDVLTLLQSSLSSWDVTSCDCSSSGRTRLQSSHNKTKLC